MTNEVRAKTIISKILYLTIATVTPDGQPWNSPVYSAFDENYNFYWASWKENQHSKNIANNNNVFLVIYDSTAPEGTGEGVYIQAKAFELTDEKEIAHALNFLDGRVNKKKDPETRVRQFQGDYPRRVYKAIPEKVWINNAGEINGNYVDVRIELGSLSGSD
jgi:nitroimidazol reductase NimA-like FMN-containing flavoprotein (pyridoxamine 5'-phosphate oxidase superfamily)